MHRIAIRTKQRLTDLSDLIWPGRSLISGEPARGALSAADFAALNFITGTVCDQCGRPMTLDLGPDGRCGACIASPPPWTRGRAALVYDEISRIPIIALKRAGRRDGLHVMANWMATSGADLLTGADLIVPIPLHYYRLVQRGYNQAGWLATAIGRQAGIEVAHTALKRKRATQSQAGLSARARSRNVSGAFAVGNRSRKRISGRTLVLVDDVMTTGATLRAACRALLKGGAAHIHVLVLARVVRETDITI